MLLANFMPTQKKLVGIKHSLLCNQPLVGIRLTYMTSVYETESSAKKLILNFCGQKDMKKRGIFLNSIFQFKEFF